MMREKENKRKSLKTIRFNINLLSCGDCGLRLIIIGISFRLNPKVFKYKQKMH